MKSKCRNIVVDIVAFPASGQIRFITDYASGSAPFVCAMFEMILSECENSAPAKKERGASSRRKDISVQTSEVESTKFTVRMEPKDLASFQTYLSKSGSVRYVRLDPVEETWTLLTREKYETVIKQQRTEHR